ncbi:MAG: amidase [Bauldia sp.]|uniref:amidase n=1 Tax=Bauldia sp. TaxID=2575872 RepID=UPI001D580684|nr:amidase [Bauldia sp.]MCB1495438.1 amidase [Bauldia sp.]
MADDISGTGMALRSGASTAEALLDRCLDRIRRIDPRLNSFVALDEAGAREAARESDARLASGAARSALEGIPISVKDNILVAGMPATWGSRALAKFIPEIDELPVARLRAAGAVIVGKTNVPELTLEGYTDNELFGVTRNPWNVALTPGGSSGGAAAGVAAGLVTAAIGTDGGGSIRRPACHTGLVGWKPSAGHVPRIDGFPSILTDFEAAGALTTSVADAALLDGVMAPPDPRDRRSLYAPAPPWPADKPRILYIPQFGDSPVDSEVATATADIAVGLAGEGYPVREATVFFDLDDAGRIWYVISRAGAAWLGTQYNPEIGALAGKSVRTMIADGEKLTGADYIDVLERIAAFRRRCAELFEDVDLVLTPTAAALPWDAATPFPDMIAGKAAGPRDHAVFTGWANIAGVPAINLPVAVSKAGLPIGVQFAAGFGADASLLAFAEALAERYPAPALPILEGQS